MDAAGKSDGQWFEENEETLYVSIVYLPEPADRDQRPREIQINK